MIANFGVGGLHFSLFPPFLSLLILISSYIWFLLMLISIETHLLGSLFLVLLFPMSSYWLFLVLLFLFGQCLMNYEGNCF